jgi:hypothetical protein
MAAGTGLMTNLSSASKLSAITAKRYKRFAIGNEAATMATSISEMEQTVAAVLAPYKSILAADESTGTLL